MKRTVRLLSVLVATMLALAACSTAEEAGREADTEAGAPAVSSEPEVVPPSPAPASEPATGVTEPSPSTTAPAGGTDDTAGTTSQSILELAAENPQLSQLVAAAEVAGLTDRLEQAGPLTVFAPNNDAFAQLNQSDLTALLSDPNAIGDRLRYHVVEGTYTTDDLNDGDTLTTLEGSELPVSVQGGTVTVGGAEVVQADIEAGNGVIHIINGVLEP